MKYTKQMLLNKISLIEKMLDLPRNSLNLYPYKHDKRRLYKLVFSTKFEKKGLQGQNFCPYFTEFMRMNEIYHLLQGALAGIEQYERLKKDFKAKTS